MTYTTSTTSLFDLLNSTQISATTTGSTITRVIIDEAQAMRPIAPLMSYWQSIRPDPSGSKALQFRLHLRDGYSPPAKRDRLNNMYRSIPASFGSTRQEIKRTLKAIGAKLGEFQRDDDQYEALSYVNTYQTAWRDYFDSDDIFNSLFSGYFFKCNDCGALESEDDGGTCYDDYRVCDSCLSDGYTWSDNRDTYINNDDWHEEQNEDDDEDREDSSIGSYHSSKRHLGHIPSSFDNHTKPIYLGLELEMEIKDDYSRNDKAEQLLDAIGSAQINGKHYTYAMCEGDGSLNHGFEMVTGWTGLDTHAKQLEFFKEPFRGAKSHDTQTCGLHVHICKSDMSMLHCAKMILFVNESANQKLIRAIARRDGARYSRILNKKASYEWLKNAKGGSKANRIQRLNNDRYEALNFQNEKTIEFRIFKGTLKYESIMASLEFAYATWWFCKDTGSNDLTIANFLEFISEPENKKHTRYLREYLKDKGFALPIKGIIKANPRNIVEAQSADQSESIEA